MTLQLCHPPDSNSLDHDAAALPPPTTGLSRSNSTISVLCYLLLIGCCKGKCFTANRTSASTCTLCFEGGGDFSNCSITNKPDFTEALCRSTCCTVKYSSALPSACFVGSPGVQSSEAITLGTVLVIIFFAIPVVICIIAFIHSCVTRRQRRTPPVAARPRRHQQPPVSAISLANYNMDDQFPYLIDINDSCSICLENQCNIVTVCGHLYHSVCLAAWIHKKHKCPLCVTRDFNPITIYCEKCFKSIKMTLLFKSMTPQEVTAWKESCICKCEQCLKPEDEQLSLHMNEEDVEKYQNWKRPERPPSQIESNKGLQLGQSRSKLKE